MTDKKEKDNWLKAAIIPVIFILIISLIHLIQFTFNVKWIHYGIYPLSKKGLVGIVSAPLLHSNFEHLFNNSIPLLILGTSLFYFYKEIAFKVALWIYLMVGVWTWIYAREAYHIGASGVLYGIFSFLLVSGFLRRNNQLIALSLVVTFLYGSLVWGIFPIDIKISFESHLWGFIAGFILAFYYKKQGTQKEEYFWDDDEEEENENAYWKEGVEPFSNKQIHYTFKKKE